MARRHTIEVLVEAIDEVSSVFGDIENEAERTFKNVRKSCRMMDDCLRDLEKPLQDLPDHLEPFDSSIRKTGRELRKMAKQSEASFEDLRDAALRSRVELDKIASVSKSGKKAIKTIQELTEATREAQAAAIGLNRDGTVKISARQAARQMAQFEEAIEDARKQLEKLRDAGDFGSYEAGMKVLAVRTKEVRQAMKAATGDVRAFQKTLDDLGIATSNAANRSAVAMEAYKERFIRSVDMMNAKATQSQKMMELLGEVKYIPVLDKAFLRIGHRLEEMAKRGRAANIALDMLGRNASMKELQDRIKLINQGLGRMQALQMGMLIFTALFTYGVILLSNEVDGRLIPAFEEFKKVWLDALTPFAKMWTTFVGLPILKAITAIGNFVDRLNEINPNITAIGGMFLWLFSVLTLLLSPLAIGIGLGYGMRAAFTALWSTIRPFVLGFLRVAGAAAFWAAVIIAVVAAIRHLWKTNENFRNAVLNVWNAIKSTVQQVIDFLKPYILDAWNAISGGTESALQVIGDKVAVVLNWIAEAIRAAAPYIIAGLKFVIDTLKTIWNDIKPGVQAVIQWIQDRWNQIKSWFQSNGPGMLDGLKQAWETIKPAVSAVVNFIRQIWNQLIGFFNQHGAMILQALTNVWNTIATVIGTVLRVIYAIFVFIWPAIQFIIVSVWNNIKGVIQGAIGVILSIIQIFAALFTGNWSALWDGIVNFVKSAWTLIWNGFQLLLWGRLVKGALALGQALLNVFRSGWQWIVNIFRSAGQSIWSWISSIFSRISSFTREIWNGIKSFFGSIWNGIKNFVMQGVNYVRSQILARWTYIKSITSSVWNGIKSFFSSVWNGIKSFVSNAVSNIRSRISSTWSSIRSATSSAWNAIKSAISNGLNSAWSFIKGMAGRFLSAGRGLIDALARGIRSAMSKAISAVKSGLQTIRKYLPFSPAKIGPLSDLDKSGASFFPTWASKMHQGVRPMVKNVTSGLDVAVSALSASQLAAPAVSPAMAAPAAARPDYTGTDREPTRNITYRVEVNFHRDVNIGGSGSIMENRRRLSEFFAREVLRRMRTNLRPGGGR